MQITKIVQKLQKEFQRKQDHNNAYKSSKERREYQGDKKLKFDCNSIESHTAIEGSHEIVVRMRTSVFEAQNVIAYSIRVQLQQITR